MSATSMEIDSGTQSVDIVTEDTSRETSGIVRQSMSESEHKQEIRELELNSSQGVDDEEQFYEDDASTFGTSANSFVLNRFDMQGGGGHGSSENGSGVASTQCICFLREFVHCHASTSSSVGGTDHGSISGNGSLHILSTLSRHEVIESEYEGTFVNYEIVVVNAPQRWTVWRRYSEFRTLHTFLMTLPEFSNPSGGRRPPKLPSKKWFGQLRQDFVESRKAQLTVYWDELMEFTDVLTYIPEFLSFIGILHSKFDPTSSNEDLTAPLSSGHARQNSEDGSTSPPPERSNTSGSTTPNNGTSSTATPANTVQTKSMMVETVLNLAEAGDLIFMRNSGIVHTLHRTLFKTDYDHVGVVVRIPPLNLQPQSLYLLEATSEGVHVQPLKERLYNCNATNVKLGYRRLLGVRTDSMKIAIASVAEQHDGKEYRFAPSRKDKTKVHDDSSSKKGFFCSEIVALALQKAGILGCTRIASSYFPSHLYESVIPGGIADGFIFEQNQRVNFRYPEIHFAQVQQSKGWFTSRGMDKRKLQTESTTRQRPSQASVPFYIYAQCCGCASRHRVDDVATTPGDALSLERRNSLLREITRCLALPSGVGAKHVWDQEAEVIALGQQPSMPPVKFIREQVSDRVKGQLLQPAHAYQVPAHQWHQIHDKTCVLHKVQVVEASQESCVVTLQMPLPTCAEHVRRQRSRALVEREWATDDESATQDELSLYDMQRERSLHVRGQSPCVVRNAHVTTPIIDIPYEEDED